MTRNVVRNAVLLRDEFRCRKCGTKGCRKNPLTLHHIKFRCQGGGSTMENLITWCTECHRAYHKEYDKLYGTPHRSKQHKKEKSRKNKRRAERRRR